MFNRASKSFQRSHSLKSWESGFLALLKLVVSRLRADIVLAEKIIISCFSGSPGVMQVFTGRNFGCEQENLDDIKLDLAEAIKAEDFQSEVHLNSILP